MLPWYLTATGHKRSLRRLNVVFLSVNRHETYSLMEMEQAVALVRVTGLEVDGTAGTLQFIIPRKGKSISKLQNYVLSRSFLSCYFLNICKYIFNFMSLFYFYFHHFLFYFSSLNSINLMITTLFNII